MSPRICSLLRPLRMMHTDPPVDRDRCAGIKSQRPRPAVHPVEFRRVTPLRSQEFRAFQQRTNHFCGGQHRESTASCSCLGSKSPKRPYRYLATVHRSPGQSWRTFIRGQVLAFKHRDDLEYSNQDWQSRADCSFRGNLRRSAGQITKLETGTRCLSQARGIAAPSRFCTRSASLRIFRCGTAHERPSTAGANPVSVSVRMRGPPRYIARFL